MAPGTNGGVTVDGFKYGGLGSSLLVFTCILALTFLPPHIDIHPQISAILIGSGIAGTVIDSVLGALCQVTVSDKGSGRVVEGVGGSRVRVLEGGSRVQIGKDLLTNNGVNFVMAMLASLLAMGVAGGVGLGLEEGVRLKL